MYTCNTKQSETDAEIKTFFGGGRPILSLGTWNEGLDEAHNRREFQVPGDVLYEDILGDDGIVQ